MKSIGGLLLLFGLGSIVLYFLNMNFKLLMWIENWGPNVGWGIRIGMAVVGAILFIVASKQSQSAS